MQIHLIMKHLTLLLLLLFATPGAWAQEHIRGIVVDKSTGEALPFVNIVFNQSTYGTTSDANGRFEIRTQVEINDLTFSFMGYEKQTLSLKEFRNLKKGRVKLMPLRFELEEVELVARENPAHRIIRRAIANKNINNPENLNSFSYTSYSKFIITSDPDNIPEAPDTLWTSQDSSRNELKQRLLKSHLYIAETATERVYSKKKGNKEEVLASRMAGLKEPIYEILALKAQSFSFYDDNYEFLGTQYVNPISKGSLRKYFYDLTDTIIDAQDSIFVIQYRPLKGKSFKGLKGVLHINSDQYAVQNVIARLETQNNMGIKLEQQYKRFEGQWFPAQNNIDLSIGDMGGGSNSPIEIMGYNRTYISDIKINPDTESERFSRVEMSMDKKAGERNEAFWSTYRKDSLSQREQATYTWVDSIGRAQNFDRRIKSTRALVSGYWPLAWFNIDLSSIMNFNSYEGFRLGLGGETNHKLSDRWRFGGYFAYGFKDKKFKYQVRASYLMDRMSDARIGLSYTDDVAEAGQSLYMLGTDGDYLNDYRRFASRNFYKEKSFQAFSSFRPVPELSALINYKRSQSQRDFLFPDEEASDFPEFTFNELSLALHWTPFNAYMQTQYGRVTIEEAYPQFLMQYTYNISEGQETPSYHKVDAKMDWTIESRQLGSTELQLSGAYVSESAPDIKWYYGPSNNYPGKSVGRRFTIAGIAAFETMYPAEFFANTFVALNLRQRFPAWRITNNIRPELAAVARAAWGFDLRDEQADTRQDFHKGYYEVGLELNHILMFYGLGLYTRLGPYRLEDRPMNLSLRMTINVDLFEQFR